MLNSSDVYFIRKDPRFQVIFCNPVEGVKQPINSNKAPSFVRFLQLNLLITPLTLH